MSRVTFSRLIQDVVGFAENELKDFGSSADALQTVEIVVACEKLGVEFDYDDVRCVRSLDDLYKCYVAAYLDVALLTTT